jgi:hypothetical protein
MTTSAFVSAQCPAGPKQAACQSSARAGLGTAVLVRAAPGAANLLAAVPALLAARSQPARLLRAE